MDGRDLSRPHAGGGDETTPVEPPGPLDESQFAMVRQAAQARKVVEKLIRRTSLSAAVTLVLATGCAVVAVIWPDWINVAAAVALGAIGAVELWGHRRIRQGESRAATVLGCNQLALLTLIVVYCVAQMAVFSPEAAKSSVLSAEMRAQMAEVSGMQHSVEDMIDRWGLTVTYGFYSFIIVLSALFQGRSAAYYFGSRKHVEAFHRQTPSWIRRLFTEMGR